MLAEIETLTGWKERTPEVEPARVNAFTRLALAVVIQAVRDAGKDSRVGEQARTWLLSQDAELYLSLAGVEPGAIKQWIQAGAPLPTRKT